MHVVVAMRILWELLLVMLLTLCSKAIGTKPCTPRGGCNIQSDNSNYCLSWRLAVEVNNIHSWRTIPTQCQQYVESYMTRGQYKRDIEMVISQISCYIRGIVLENNGTDAWILDIDDTCISNLFYYRGKRFGCDPYDPVGFRSWAMKGICPAIPAVLRLFRKLIDIGFKVLLLSGRDEEILGQATKDNLHNQGFIGYERLILRSPAYRGQKAVFFKSNMRKQLEEQGYRIWGNVGDQWSDLTGDSLGDRTFKLPNPMYFVP
ncbi:hypothetical protein GIB67_041083 [Kingdonia uniflora]|uniref:Acid phosphatase 1 n=1 Tax=Kingdonia uniflora TaxID=39325 RepID=A0A7J7LK16_9MAGN|nr:hypothetical protein GIB67_041083 [Kingdonia uniflora]